MIMIYNSNHKILAGEEESGAGRFTRGWTCNSREVT